MSWTDLGVIFPVHGLEHWAQSHAYVPTALMLDDRIRVYVAFWDDLQIGRLGYIDVDSEDPRRVLGHSRQPLLDLGALGTFDQDGITPMAVTRHNDEIRLYYAGWRRYEDANARYTLFTGLATSRDGLSFARHPANPILGPSGESSQIRTLGSIVRETKGWRCYFAEDVGRIDADGKIIPTYQLSTMTSGDGVTWSEAGTRIFAVSETAFGYGRSAIWKTGSSYQGEFSVRRRGIGYRAIEYATSEDGISWTEPGITGMAFGAEQTCDGQREVSFPSLVTSKAGTIMFYNGDGFGKEGLRAAIWSPNGDAR